jgi:metal-responsive CopG/Arc/MetJ family transcriptional regulator
MKKYIRWSVSMPTKLIAQLDQVAAHEGVTRSALMRKIIIAHLVEKGLSERPA